MRRRADRRQELGHDAAFQHTFADQPQCRGRRKLVGDIAVDENTGTSLAKTMREAPRPTARAAAASSAFTFSGPAASGSTTGNTAGGERVENSGWGARQRIADEAEPGCTRGEQADLVAGERHGRPADRRAHACVHGSERLADDLEARHCRHAATRHEADGDSAPLHRRGDLRPCAVHDDHVVTVCMQLERTPGGLGRDAATELEHDPRHVVYLEFRLT